MRFFRSRPKKCSAKSTIPNDRPALGSPRRLRYEMLECRRMLAAVQWVGGAAGLWDQAGNWSNNAVPTSADDVTISTASPTVTIQSSDNESVNSVTVASGATLVLSGGSLTVAANSTISGMLSMTAGSLAANGGGVTLAVSGPTSISGGSLYAYSGATLSLPNMTTYAESNNNSPTFQANGSGSVINLSGLTSISGMTNWLYIQAQAGGEVDLSQVASITNSYINISADGTDASNVPSKIDLSALSTISETGGPYWDLSATNGGDVLDPMLTAPATVNITIGATNGGPGLSQMNTSQWTSFEGGSISLYQNANLSGLTDIDGTSLYANNGATLSLPNVTSYSLTTNDSPTFQAYGTGSTISLPGLNSMSGLTTWLYIQARAGGEVNLSQVASITDSYVNISADGTTASSVPSTINLSDLATFSETGGPYGDLSATNGGDVIDPLLTEPNAVNITLGATNGGSVASQMNISQITSLLGSSISLYQNASFSGLTDIDGTSLYTNNGATLSLPNVTSYSLSNDDSPTFQAYGTGSTINLLGLTTISGTTNWLYINARDGGEVNLSKVTSITNSYVNISADSTDAGNVPSTINLSAWATFSENGPYGDLSATNGGEVIDPLLTAPNALNITLGATNGGATTSQMNISQITSLLGGSISLYQNATFGGLTDIDGSSLYTSNGATLSLPNVTSYSLINNDSPTFQAYGAGSAIDMLGLIGFSGLTNWMYINARAGGEVDLSNVASISNSYVNISSDGTATGNVASKIDLSALTTFSEANGPYGFLSATNGGDVVDPLLTAPVALNITLGTEGATTPSEMNTSQLTSLVAGSISLYQTANLSGLTVIDGSSLYASNGATLSLPNVTIYSLTDNNSPTFQSSDPGSVIALPGLTGISGLNYWLYINARNGGEVDLSKVTGITNSYVNISSDGLAAGNVASTIDLSALTSFSDTSGPYAFLSATDGGTVLSGNLTTMSGIYVTLSGGGTITNQWTTVNNCTIYVYDDSYTFSNLANISGSNVYVQRGGALSLPAVTSLTGVNGYTYFQASGTGSTLSLPSLTTITATSPAVSIQAQSEGVVLLPAVTTLNGAQVYFSADGTGSIITLTALTTYTTLNASATNGGQIVYTPITPVFQWVGNGDGTSWSDPANWSTDQVPGPLDDAVINLAGNPTIVYNAAAGNTTIYALTCSDPLSITGGSLTVTANSTISGSLTMTGGTLAASGANVTLTANGSTTITDANLYAEAGATLSLPNLASYSHVNGGNTATLEATGSGSKLSLVDLAAVTVATGYATYLNIEALAGGNVSLPILATVSTGPLALLSDGGSSVLAIPDLTAFSTASGSWTGSVLQASNGGTVQDSGLTSLTTVNLVLGTGGILTLGTLSDLDNSNVTVEGGASLSLTGLTSYAHASYGNTSTLEATGSGSTLTLPSLATLTVATNYATFLNIEALAGGDVNLPDLTGINTGPMALISSGASSVMNISALTSYSLAAGSWTYSLLQAGNGGKVEDAALTSLAGVNLPIDGTSTISTSQITSFTGGILTLSGGSLILGALTNLNDASVTVEVGANLSLPDVAGYSHLNYGNTATLEATGAGSTLTLADLAAVTVATNYATYLNIGALAGGNVSLPILATVNTGPVTLLSDGASSVLNIPDLKAFSTVSGSWTGSLLQASNGGTVQDTVLTSLTAVNLVLSAGGIVTLGTLTDLDNSNVTVEGGASLSLSGVIGYTHASYGDTNTLEATGSGSTLTLPNLTTLTVATGYATYLNIEALLGGSVNLPDLTSIDTGPMALISSGSSSVLNISALTAYSLASGSWTYSLLQASNGGKLQDAHLTSLAGVNLYLDGASTAAISQITTYNGGTLAVSGGTYSFTALANLNDSSVTVEGGASLSFPVVAGYSHLNYGNTDTLEATGAGSTLTLADLSALTVATSYATYLNVEALAGGNVNLPILASIKTGPATLLGDGGSSVLDLSDLASYSPAAGSWTGSLLQASNGGTVYFGQAPSPSAQGILIDTGGQVLLGGGLQVTGSLVNNGSLTLGGTVTLTGAYTQTSGATLIEQIGGTQAGQFGLLTASQTAALAGTLDVALTNGYQPAQGNATQFLSSPGVSGQFSSVVNVSPGSLDTFGATYTSTTASVVATAVVLPNLVAGTVTAPATALPDQAVTVSWTDVNQGTATATGNWVDRIYQYLSPTDNNPTLLASVPFSGTIGVGQTAHLSAMIDFTQSGTYYIGVTTDYFHQVIEVSGPRQNTTISSQATLVDVPDLVAESAQASVNAAQFGQTISVTWTVQNNGSAAAAGDWTDEVYLSSQQSVNAGATVIYQQSENAYSPLAVGASYTTTAQVTLPLSANVTAGTYYLVVLVNATQSLAEGSTANNQAASSAISITLPALPSLGVSGLSAATHQVYPGQSLNLSWTVKNNGGATATGPWNDEVYLASDAQGDNETLLGTFPDGNSLTAGASYTSTEEVVLPSQATGQGWLVVTADPQSAVLEPGTAADRTEIDSTPLTFGSFKVSAATSVQVSNAGAPIPFTGTAVDATTGNPVPDVPVAIVITTAGTTRTITATTNAQGDFTATFQPLATEAGYYQYTAGSSQGQFEIVGMSISTQSALNVAVGVPVSGSETVTNLGPIPLTDLTVNVIGAPANIQVQASPSASSLAGSGSITLNFTVTASSASVTSADVLVVLQSQQGAAAELTLPVTVLPLVPELAAQPGTLIDGMLVGSQTIVQFNVVNDGGASSGALQVLAPQSSFMTLTSPATIPPIAPGGSSTVTLQLLPAANFTLGTYTGTISLLGAADSLNVPFQFEAVSQTVGNVVIDAEDELTFFTQGAPLVAGASVVLSNTQTGAAVASGTTGAGGTLELDGLQVGTYNVTVQAQGHNAYQGSVTVQAGTTTTVDAFMTSQLITYQFNVTPTTIQDQYTFSVNTTFTTHVPIPVVTVSPAYIDFSTITAATTQINFTLTNQGLIAAQNVAWSFGSDSDWQVTPLVSTIGTLPAESSITIPVTIQRLSPGGGPIQPADDSGCPSASYVWSFLCGGNQEGQSGAIAYLNAGGNCPAGIPIFPTGGGGLGGGGIIYTSGVSTSVRSLNLCDPKDAAKLAGAIKDLGLTVLGVVGGPITGLAVAGYQISNDGGKGDWVGVGLDIGGVIPGVGSVISIIGGARSIYNDLADPPQNVTPQLSAAMAQLDTETDRLQAVANVYTEFFGSPDWVSLASGDTAGADQESAWLQAFFQDATGAGGSALPITTAQQSALLAMPLPAPITTADAQNFIARWNNTLAYNAQGIINLADVPPGQSTNFIAADVMQAYVLAAQNALAAMQTEGYTGLYDAMTAAANSAMNAFELANDTGVCATVQLQINQTAIITRSAFAASFELDNQKPADTLTDLSVNLQVFDLSGNNVTSDFFISAPTLQGLTAINGTGTLAPDTSGTADWTIIPTTAAAADGITNYLVEGTLSYFDNVQVTIPILPSEITVYPSPSLHVSYFLQQDVYGDDPFIPQVATPQPFALGLLVTNTGPGDAGDFTITSSQPQIVSNEKGLLVSFNITGAQVGNQPVTPSLTADLGTIDSGRTVVADWQLTSSLDGTFSNMSATYQHTNALGGTSTSIIDSVSIHDMVRMVQPNRAGDNGDPAFLVDSSPNTTDLPDTLYLANGTTATVNVASNPVASGQVSNSNLDVQVTCNETSGWDYLQMPDPGDGFTLIKIVRSDGTPILVGPDAWTTHPVDAGTDDPSADLLHILDYNGTGSYTLYYLPVGAQPPAAISLSAVSPNPTSGAVPSIDLTLNEYVDPATFNRNDVSLTLNNGANLINSGVTLTQISGSTYQISGLASLTSAQGVYQLTVLPGVVQDSAGELSTGTVYSNWANGNVGPYVTSVASVSPNPRNTPVSSVTVNFDEAIVPASFTYQAVSLTLNGGANLINSGVGISEVTSSTYHITGLSSLTANQGTYALIVNAADVQDAGAQAGIVTDTDNTSWTMDTTAPTISSLQAVTQSPRSIIVPSLTVTFSTAINPATFTLSNISFSKTGGPNLVNASTTITQLSPTEFQIAGFNNFLYPIDGTYTFTVSAAGVVDLAGNSGAGSVSESWVMDTNPPDAATHLAITPDTGISATDGITNTGNVTLTGSVDQTGLLLDVYDGTTEIVTDAAIQGESISAPLVLADGNHDLRVDVVDSAAQVSADAFLTVLVDQVAPAVTIQPVTPNVLSAPLASATISFSKPVYGFTLADLQLTNGNGPNLLTGGSPTLTSSDNQTWTLGNFSGLTGADGNYTLTLSAAGITDAAGNALPSGTTMSFSVDAAPTATIRMPSPNPRNTPVDSLTITFSKAVYGFTAANLTLSENGGANLLTSSSQALTTSNNVTWTLNNLSSLTGTNGTYVLSISPAGITDASGDTLAAAASNSFQVDTIPPTSKVNSLPAVSVGTQFSVQWSGQDNAGGSGIASYDIYVQDNGGTFTLWQANTPATSAVYTGVAGHTYGFYSVATDNAGNQEVKTPTVESSILVQALSQVAVTTNYPTGAVYGQTVNVTATVTSNDPPAGTPTGSIQFQINGVNYDGSINLVNGQAGISVPGLTVASYTISATYTSNSIDFANGSGSFVQKVTPAPVQLGLQSNPDWILAGQQVSFTAVASTTATSNGTALTPDGSVTFYDNGAQPNTQSLSVVAGQDQAGYNTTTLPLGKHLITATYTSSSGNYAMSSASPILVEMVYASTATVLTVNTTSSNPAVMDSLPWAVAQANASNAATVITFAAGNGQPFATAQTITLEQSLNLTDTSIVGIDGPPSGVTLVGDYSQSRFPIVSVAQGADLYLREVGIGLHSPGADGDLTVSGVLGVLQAVTNLGSAVNVTGGTTDLGGQTITADSLTLTNGNVTDGTLSAGAFNVINGSISANLAGSGSVIETGSGRVVISGNNSNTGGTIVTSGTLVAGSKYALLAGSSLMVGSGASSLFAPAVSAGAALAGPNAVATASVAAPVERSVSAANATAGPGPGFSRTLVPIPPTVIAPPKGGTTNRVDAVLQSAGPLFPGDLAGLASAAAPWWTENQGQRKDLSLQALDAVLAEYGE